ncbi:hypothetical protein [Exiguobacterium flavidum]|uniref:hypothetical protein n=1 Tax=Exiguobacterium flavidum TaxID=2184695 RepID=UPI000DF7C558|nr:hypothetical protein [Exiguobacterium flavidum]
MGKRWMPEAYATECMRASMFSTAEKDMFIASLDAEVSDDDRLYILSIIRPFYETNDLFEEYEELIDRQGDFYGRTIIEGLLARERFEKRSTRALLMNHGLHLPYALALEVERALEWAEKPDTSRSVDHNPFDGMTDHELTEVERDLLDGPLLFDPSKPVRDISDEELMRVLAEEPIEVQVLYLNSMDLRLRGEAFTDFIVKRYVADAGISKQSLLVLRHLLFALSYTEYAGPINLKRRHSGLRYEFKSAEDLQEHLFGSMMQRVEVEERVEEEMQEEIEDGNFDEEEAEEESSRVIVMYDMLETYLFPEVIDLSGQNMMEFAFALEMFMGLDELTKKKRRKEGDDLAYFEQALSAVLEEFRYFWQTA